jgi:HAD superfamily hydrolase (TIGR01459 family)
MSVSAVQESLADLPERYRVVLCDIWGVVHDGVTVFPDARTVLARWSEQGRIVLLLTNAPRPSRVVRAQLDQLGLDRGSYSSVVSSGEAGVAAIRASGVQSVGFIGTASDRQVMIDAGLAVGEGPEGDIVVCTGLVDGSRDPAEHDVMLEAMLRRGARLFCFNPDRVVLRGGIAEPCAGAIAERYEAMGGAVEWFGKPYAPIYERCLEVAAEIAGRPIDRSEVVAVGDSIRTDFVGAADAGFDFVFITHGIEGEKIDLEGAEALVARFEQEHGIELPTSIAAAPRLA